MSWKNIVVICGVAILAFWVFLFIGCDMKVGMWDNTRGEIAQCFKESTTKDHVEAFNQCRTQYE